MRKHKDLLLTDNISITHLGGRFKAPKGKILRVKLMDVKK